MTRLNVRACYRVVDVCVSHLGETNITSAVQGSSGGPVFANHVGYGLVSGYLGNYHMVYQGIRYVERTSGAYIFAF